MPQLFVPGGGTRMVRNGLDRIGELVHDVRNAYDVGVDRCHCQHNLDLV